MRHIKIVKEDVKKIDMTPIEHYVLRDGANFSEAGVEAYKFYAYLSTLLNDSIIIEVGSRFGRSGLALAYNENNTIISFDILEQGASEIKRPNLLFKIGNFMNSAIDWSSVDVIMIDVDHMMELKNENLCNIFMIKNGKDC